MDPHLTAFLQYGYVSLKDEVTSLMTLYAASLAFVAAFSDKIVNMSEAPGRVRDAVEIGTYLLIAAVAVVLVSLVPMHGVLKQLELWSDTPRPLALRLLEAEKRVFSTEIALAVSGVVYVFGLLAILGASMRMTALRIETERHVRLEKMRQLAMEEDAAAERRAREL